jgi:hypothetical protein
MFFDEGIAFMVDHPFFANADKQTGGVLDIEDAVGCS